MSMYANGKKPRPYAFRVEVYLGDRWVKTRYFDMEHNAKRWQAKEGKAPGIVTRLKRFGLDYHKAAGERGQA